LEILLVKKQKDSVVRSFLSGEVSHFCTHKQNKPQILLEQLTLTVFYKKTEKGKCLLKTHFLAKKD